MAEETSAPQGTYDERSALIVVDMQNDFAHPEGSLHVEGGHELVARINAEIAEARAGGALVIYTQDTHPPSTPHFEQHGGQWPEHGVRESWGWKLHAGLVVDAAAPVVQKGVEGGDGYSGFSVRDPESGDEHDTELDSILGEHGVERVVVVGLAQDWCVRATALDALERGYGTEVLTTATAPVDLEPGAGKEALEELREAGVEVI